METGVAGSMVYSRGKIHAAPIGEILLSAAKTAREWKTTRPTIKIWVETGVVQAHDSPVIDGKTNHRFEPKYVTAAAPILQKAAKVKHGPKLTPDDRKKLDAINRRFYPERFK